MSCEFETIEVSRRYNNRAKEYRWESRDVGTPVAGWDNILRASRDRLGTDVGVCWWLPRTNMEATGYRLFFKRNLR